MFEIQLKENYEQIKLVSKVKQHLGKTQKGAIGYSPKRLSKTPVKEMLKRALPGAKLSKDGKSLKAKEWKVKINLN
jgi:hypothetical protein